MQTLHVQLDDELAARVAASAADASVTVDEYVATALASFAKRRPRTEAENAAITAEYNAYAAEVDTALSPAEMRRRSNVLREVEW